MRRWHKVGLGIAILAWLLLGVVALVDDWRDEKRRFEDSKQAEDEWSYWIALSCNLPPDLGEVLAGELAVWSPFAPSDLLSDFAYVRSLESQVMSELRPTIKVPTELSGYIQYRLRQGATTLPKHRSPSAVVIDSCAQNLHEEMVAFKSQVQEETEVWIDHLCQGNASWRESGLLDCKAE